MAEGSLGRTPASQSPGSGSNEDMGACRVAAPGSTPPVEPASGLDAAHSDPLRKHTPGPWHVGGRFAGVEDFIVYDANGWGIADARNFHGKSGVQTMQANARLIAAAPDLLAAARSIIASIHRSPVDIQEDEAIAWPLLGSELLALSAAISKATGTDQEGSAA